MAEYYLISQLPSLDGVGESTPLPITEERFLTTCEQFLSKPDFDLLTGLSLAPSRDVAECRCALVNGWNKGERDLRLMLAKIRGEKMNKPFSVSQEELAGMPAGLAQTARTATEMDSPLEAERFLNQYRLQLLETLRPMDAFSREFVLYYWLKLQLLSRIRRFDTASGEQAYKNIYNSIMNGDSLEDTQ
jgi:hypothetical protein